jgi:phospholipase/lecithinase/hemolysin
MSIVYKMRAAVIAAVLLGSSLLCHAAPASFDAIYIFGDSYCDVGNIYIATGGAVPAAPYYQGRFSNGPIWLDHLAGTYGLTLKPYLGGGTDFAFGGAMVTAAVPEGAFSIPSVPQQVALYLSLHNGKADPNALYVVEGGGNDILNATGGSPQTLGNEIAFGLASSIELLERAGARNILTSNLLDVGQLPGARAEGISSFATAASLATNKALDLLLLLESFSPTTHLYRIDAYALFQSVLTDPFHYGFTDVTDPCLTTTVCSNPYVNFFWDEEHPTIFGHSFFAVVAQGLLKQ